MDGIIQIPVGNAEMLTFEHETFKCARCDTDILCRVATEPNARQGGGRISASTACTGGFSLGVGLRRLRFLSIVRASAQPWKRQERASAGIQARSINTAFQWVQNASEFPGTWWLQLHSSTIHTSGYFHENNYTHSPGEIRAPRAALHINKSYNISFDPTTLSTK